MTFKAERKEHDYKPICPVAESLKLKRFWMNKKDKIDWQNQNKFHGQEKENNIKK